MSNYNLRPRRVINYNEDAYYENAMNEVKTKSQKNKNPKKVDMNEYVTKLRYHLILNDELKGQNKIENVMKCIDMAVFIINNYNIQQNFINVVKNKIQEFLKDDIIKDMNRVILQEYLQMLACNVVCVGLWGMF
jgi:hypothetical protein